MIEKLDILAFGAHPDDVELGCGGTLAKEISSGKKVGVVDLTKGELGTRGTAEVRSKESSMASEILGLKIRENLNFRDGFFKNNEEHQLKVVQVIRNYQPDIILCNALDDRHIDHPKGAKLVYDSSFLSGLSKINSTLNEKKQEPCVSFLEKTNSEICAIVKKQLKITKSKILNKSKERSIKDLTSSLQPNINKKSKIKYLD